MVAIIMVVAGAAAVDPQCPDAIHHQLTGYFMPTDVRFANVYFGASHAPRGDVALKFTAIRPANKPTGVIMADVSYSYPNHHFGSYTASLKVYDNISSCHDGLLPLSNSVTANIESTTTLHLAADTVDSLTCESTYAATLIVYDDASSAERHWVALSPNNAQDVCFNFSVCCPMVCDALPGALCVTEQKCLQANHSVREEALCPSEEHVCCVPRVSPVIPSPANNAIRMPTPGKDSGEAFIVCIILGPCFVGILLYFLELHKQKQRLVANGDVFAMDIR